MGDGRAANTHGLRTGLKSTVLALAMSTVLASSGVAADGDAAPSESPAPPAPSNRISVRIAEALGNDPEAIFSFVRDHVRYEPYSGVLRGAQGAYYSRAGNSVDQSLLLARLLDAAEVPIRFAVGSVDEGTAEALLASSAADEAVLREQHAMALFGRLAGDAAVPPVPRAVEYAPIYQTDQETGAEAWAQAELVDTLAMISSAIDEAGLEVQGGFSTLPDDERDTHTWIQASLGDEWIDLDPSLVTSTFGQSGAELAETMDEIPEDRRHMITLAVMAERLEDGMLVEEELLNYAGPADELTDSSITVSNIGSEAVPQLTRAFEQVLGTMTYSPVLAIDDRVLTGSRMQFKDPAGAEGGGLGGGFFETGAATPETTAEWIELTVDSPGQDPVTVRRMMFDRVGDAAREDGAFDVDALPPLESIVVDESGKTELAPLLTSWWLDVSTGMPSLRSRAIDLDVDDPRHLVVIPYAHHLMTSLAGLDLAVPLGARPFVDAPNVSGITVAVEQTPDGQPVLDSAIDIWHRSRGVVAVPGESAVETAAAVPGVLAHVAERMIGGDAGTGEASQGSVSVGAVFDAVAEAGVGIRAIDGSASVAELPYPAEARGHLARSLADGWVAIVPERPVTVAGTERVGWWLVDPITGRVADQMDDGRGEFGEWLTFEHIAAAFAAIGAGTIFALAAQAGLEFFTSTQWTRADNILKDQLKF